MNSTVRDLLRRAVRDADVDALERAWQSRPVVKEFNKAAETVAVAIGKERRRVESEERRKLYDEYEPILWSMRAGGQDVERFRGLISVPGFNKDSDAMEKAIWERYYPPHDKAVRLMRATDWSTAGTFRKADRLRALREKKKKENPVNGEVQVRVLAHHYAVSIPGHGTVKVVPQGGARPTEKGAMAAARWAYGQVCGRKANPKSSGALYCPECGERAKRGTIRREGWALGVDADRLQHVHLDGTSLCPVMTSKGYQPALLTSRKPNPLHGGRSGPVQSAWSRLLPQFKSEHVGWSTHGEFYCPYCDTQIGKNLRGQQPFLLASQHLKEHGVGKKSNPRSSKPRCLECSRAATSGLYCSPCASRLGPHAFKRSEVPASIRKRRGWKSNPSFESDKRAKAAAEARALVAEMGKAGALRWAEKQMSSWWGNELGVHYAMIVEAIERMKSNPGPINMGAPEPGFGQLVPTIEPPKRRMPTIEAAAQDDGEALQFDLSIKRKPERFHGVAKTQADRSALMRAAEGLGKLPKQNPTLHARHGFLYREGMHGGPVGMDVGSTVEHQASQLRSVRGDCKRCRGACEVALGPRMVPCPSCQRKPKASNPTAKKPRAKRASTLHLHKPGCRCAYHSGALFKNSFGARSA